MDQWNQNEVKPHTWLLMMIYGTFLRLSMKKVLMKMLLFHQELLISYIRACWKGNQKSFVGEFHLDSQSSFISQVLSSFVDMILQGTNINQNKKYLEQANLTISQLIGQNIVKRTRDNTTANYFCKARVTSRSLLANDGTCQNLKRNCR